MAKTTKKKSPAPPQRPAPSRTRRRQPTEEEIRRRAYEIFVSRGGAPGREAEDWLQAEAELRHG